MYACFRHSAPGPEWGGAQRTKERLGIDGQRPGTARPFPLWRLRSGPYSPPIDPISSGVVLPPGPNRWPLNIPAVCSVPPALRLSDSPIHIAWQCGPFATYRRVVARLPRRFVDASNCSPPAMKAAAMAILLAHGFMIEPMVGITFSLQGRAAASAPAGSAVASRVRGSGSGAIPRPREAVRISGRKKRDHDFDAAGASV
jgi:hypothetical protein